MFQLDERFDYGRIQQFATQVSRLSNRLHEELQENLEGKKSDDFYFGLLTGYANSLSTLQNDEVSEPDKQALLGAIVAIIADHIARRGF